MLFRTLLLLVALTLPAHADAFSDFVEATRKAYHVPGASVAVVQKGQVTHLQGYGVLRNGDPARVDKDTIFPLASLTKTFTAALIGRLVDQGRMDWNRPLADTLPELRLSQDFATLNVTARDFLSHRSGLPAFTGDFFDQLGYPRAEVIRRLVHMPLTAGFREDAAYSNVGFFLAGEAAARAAGTPTWEQALRQEVLTPLGMTRTGFVTGRPDTKGNVASPHLTDGTPLAEFDSQIVLAPAGLVSSTAADLAKFLQMHLARGGGFLKPETVAELFTPTMPERPSFTDLPPIGDETGFAFSQGWAVYYYNGYKVLEKGGARAGIRTVITLIPELDAGIVVLCNLNVNAFPEAVRARFLEDMAGRSRRNLQAELLERQRNLDDMFAKVGGPVPVPNPVAPSTVPLERYAGRYENPLYGSLVIRHTPQGLVWEAGPAKYGGRVDLLGRNTFQLVEPPGHVSFPAEVTFVIDAQGNPTQMLSEDYGTYTRVKP